MGLPRLVLLPTGMEILNDFIQRACWPTQIFINTGLKVLNKKILIDNKPIEIFHHDLPMPLIRYFKLHFFYARL